MLRAADIMTTDVATVRSSATVAEAVKLMQARDWHALDISGKHFYGFKLRANREPPTPLPS